MEISMLMDLLLVILFVFLGVTILVFSLDLLLKVKIPKWAEKEFLFVSTPLGAIRAIIQGEKVVDFDSNLTDIHVDKNGKYVDGENPRDKTFWEEMYGVDLLFPRQIKKIKKVVKIGSISEGDLKTETVTLGCIFKVSSNLGEYSGAETQDQAPIYMRWRATVELAEPMDFFGCEEPFMMYDSSISTGVRFFILTKTVDELFEKKIDSNSTDIKLTTSVNPELEEGLFKYLKVRLETGSDGKVSANKITGIKLIRIEIGQINITDKKVKDAVEKRLNMQKEMAARVVEAEGNKKIKVLEAEGDLDAAKIKAAEEKIRLGMANQMLRKETAIFAGAFGKNGGALGYLAKNNSTIRALGGEIYSEVNLEGEKSQKKTEKEDSGKEV